MDQKKEDSGDLPIEKSSDIRYPLNSIDDYPNLKRKAKSKVKSLLEWRLFCVI